MTKEQTQNIFIKHFGKWSENLFSEMIDVIQEMFEEQVEKVTYPLNVIE